MGTSDFKQHLSTKGFFLDKAGLDPDKDQIMEIAVLITDGELTLPYLEVRSAWDQTSALRIGVAW